MLVNVDFQTKMKNLLKVLGEYRSKTELPYVIQLEAATNFDSLINRKDFSPHNIVFTDTACKKLVFEKFVKNIPNHNYRGEVVAGMLGKIRSAAEIDEYLDCVRVAGQTDKAPRANDFLRWITINRERHPISSDDILKVVIKHGADGYENVYFDFEGYSSENRFFFDGDFAHKTFGENVYHSSAAYIYFDIEGIKQYMRYIVGRYPSKAMYDRLSSNKNNLIDYARHIAKHNLPVDMDDLGDIFDLTKRYDHFKDEYDELMRNLSANMSDEDKIIAVLRFEFKP